MRSLLALAACAALAVALPACKQDGGGPVKITVTKNGYEPTTVLAKAGQPLTLVVTRTTDETCATEFFMPEENLNVPLPLNQPVTITFTPKQAGKLRYSCAMRMFFGDIEVK
ncbi:MAG: cupredoxin domain-containing protein [Anaeromyxobacteraceae bacterium]